MTSRSDWPLWQWKSWAAAPCSRPECFERLKQVPDEFYAATLKHLQFVWSVRRELEKAPPVKRDGKTGGYHKRTETECI